MYVTQKILQLNYNSKMFFIISSQKYYFPKLFKYLLSFFKFFLKLNEVFRFYFSSQLVCAHLGIF